MSFYWIYVKRKVFIALKTLILFIIKEYDYIMK